MTDLEQMLLSMISSLVDDPASVRLDGTVTAHSAHFEVEVHPDDVGKLLGRGGVHAQSIRRLWRAAYGKNGQGFTLHIVDPRRGPERRV